ncbi:MAG: Uncharacterised protein [Flavobacteriales bacterium UBA4585]|nr:MAG: Uncharacterised protein [Flavobacteriales bacterium UBA4585]
MAALTTSASKLWKLVFSIEALIYAVDSKSLKSKL